MCRNITLVAAVNSLLQTALCVCFGVVAMLMYDCKLTPTPIQTSDPTQIPSPLVAFTNSFYLQYFHSRNNCIARNDVYWKNINDTQTGVVTKSNQVHGMFIGYIVENGLWFICSILLFFGGIVRTKWIYVTYASTQFTVILYDVILIVIFSLDFKSYKEFQGNTNTPWITKETMLVNIIVMLLIVSRFAIFLIVNVTFACLVQGFINSLPSSKMKQVKSHSKRKNASPSHHRPKQQNGPHQPPYEPYQPERFQPHHLYPPGYNASRYPDVVSHPGKFDDSSDEIIVSPAMRYGSPSRNVPAVTNYREPRNVDAGRQQTAIPPARLSSKSHESVQHPYSSNKNNRMSDRRPSPPRQRYPPERHPSPDSYRSNISYEGPPANYFEDSARKTSFNAKPQYNEDRRRQQTASVGNLPRPNEGESSQNVRFAAPMRRESFDRFSSNSDQLKNQRPWSYISPEDLPSSPNKLNQFYSSRNAMNERPPSHVLPAVDEYEPDHQPSVKQQRKREYHKRHSVELRQPLLVQHESPRHRPPPAAAVQQLYENVEPTTKKNVRFSKRTQSLDYLEKTSADSPVVKRIKQQKSKSPSKVDEKKKKVTKEEFSSSGEELCTDEFLLLNYNHSFKKSQQQDVVADASKRTVRYPNKILTDFKRSTSSASSPNLVFDPASNTARLVYGEQQSNKSFKILQSPQQRKVYLNETSI